MARAKLKTTPNSGSVTAFLKGVDHEQRRVDARRVLELMKRVTGKQPKMWGDSIVGFGSCRYPGASGKETEWFATGFSPRKQALTLYIMPGFDRFPHLMKHLGTYTTGKSCLYVKRLDDVDQGVLEDLIRESVEYLEAKYG
ncbi:MAG: DUF1801 domain-containing protein [Gemmatimonadota bacterium]